MSYLDRIAECNRCDVGRYLRLRVGDVVIGHVRDDRFDDLAAVTARFRRVDREVVWVDDGEDFERRSVVMAEIAGALSERGSISPLRDELYPAAPRALGEPRFLIDRAAVAWFGIPACGVHLNGFVRGDDEILMWVGVRSSDKTTFPGMLDNMVAGGQPHGITLWDNLIKECGEEAAIPAALAAGSVPVGAVSYRAEHDAGMKPDTMFCFDLELPRDFVPQCRDGEMARFELLPLGEVAAIVRDTGRFKFNCNLVVIGFLVRHGFLRSDDDGYAEIVAGLRRPR